jgi:hypothetical protein
MNGGPCLSICYINLTECKTPGISTPGVTMQLLKNCCLAIDPVVSLAGITNAACDARGIA